MEQPEPAIPLTPPRVYDSSLVAHLICFWKFTELFFSVCVCVVVVGNPRTSSGITWFPTRLERKRKMNEKKMHCLQVRSFKGKAWQLQSGVIGLSIVSIPRCQLNNFWIWWDTFIVVILFFCLSFQLLLSLSLYSDCRHWW